MILIDIQLKCIAGVLLILAMIFIIAGLQPLQCAPQEDLKSILNYFNTLPKGEKVVLVLARREGK
jgi:hypothetical protein